MHEGLTDLVRLAGLEVAPEGQVQLALQGVVAVLVVLNLPQLLKQFVNLPCIVYIVVPFLLFFL